MNPAQPEAEYRKTAAYLLDNSETMQELEFVTQYIVRVKTKCGYDLSDLEKRACDLRQAMLEEWV